MEYIYRNPKKGLIGFAVILWSVLLNTTQVKAQLIYQPYSYQFYQKLNSSVYSPDNNQHTAVKPFLIADSSHIRPLYDELLENNVDNSNKSWLNHFWFSGHLANVKNKDYTFYLDYLPDLQVGREFQDKKSTYLNTVAFQAFGTIGSNFFFYTSANENNAKFPNYETAYINKTGMIPGQAYNESTTGGVNWTYVTSLIGYKLGHTATIELGQDKTFIGDGYRSVLLSDYAAAYPLLRLNINIGKHVQYMAMWAYMQDQKAVQFNSFYNNRRKWGVFHFIDWNITNRASIGLFNALVTEEANDQGVGHGFDVNYVNPVLFASGLGPNSQAPDHTLLGFNAKYKVLDKTTVYGQLLFDQAAAPGTGSDNAWQLGFRGSDLFKVKRLNYLVEYNTAKPYTYANQYPIVSYTQLSEPLADPLGANYKEGIGILDYSIGRFDIQGEVQYAKYGLNAGNLNYGNDITLSNNLNIPSGPITSGQGLSTTLKYAEGTVAYVLNPKYNFRIEVGALLREETNSQSDTKTAMITLGLRSSFKNLYHDF